ncbi:hypothetical protein DER44DRAFT_678938, partial [Fusarium oxysporum]
IYYAVFYEALVVNVKGVKKIKVEIKLHRHPPIERLRGTSACERSIKMMIENALNDGFTIGTKIRVRSWRPSPSQVTQQEGLVFEDFDEVIDSRHGELVVCISDEDGVYKLKKVQCVVKIE